MWGDLFSRDHYRATAKKKSPFGLVEGSKSPDRKEGGKKVEGKEFEEEALEKIIPAGQWGGHYHLLAHTSRHTLAPRWCFV